MRIYLNTSALAVLARYRRDLPVLVVVDDADFRQLLRRALERVREPPPGLVLLDLLMPEIDGFEFVLEFRRHAEWRHRPLARITPERALRSCRAGACPPPLAGPTKDCSRRGTSPRPTVTAPNYRSRPASRCVVRE